VKSVAEQAACAAMGAARSRAEASRMFFISGYLIIGWGIPVKRQRPGKL
jgi:hypothetical protein